MNNGYKELDNKIPIYSILFRQFPNAILEICKRAEHGHQKYQEYDKDYKNYKRITADTDEDRIEIYKNAQMRHLLECGEDTKLEHASASAWNALAVLELSILNNTKLI
jgi:Domain of unknown function (DUF5664)